MIRTTTGTYWSESLTDIDPDVLKVFFENFIVNATLVASSNRKNPNRNTAVISMGNSDGPYLCLQFTMYRLLGSVIMAELNLAYEELDDIIRQGTQMGTYFYLYSGGEPMVRKDDIIRLCEAHPDCMFLAFTNGTLIDEKFADEMLRVKNFIPAISIEGFEEATDYRRGEGTYRKVKNAMGILKEKKLPFGASCCYTSKNIDSLSSEEYIDMLVESGAKFAWFFHYMPIGNTAVPELLPLPEQRETMYRKIREYEIPNPFYNRFQMTVNMLTDVLRAAQLPASTPTAISNHALSFTTQIPISERIRFWKL